MHKYIFYVHLYRTYNPEDGRGLRKPATQAQAMEELVSVVKNLKPDGYEPKIVKQTQDYLYLEYTSPILGVSLESNRVTKFYFKPRSCTLHREATYFGRTDGASWPIFNFT